MTTFGDGVYQWGGSPVGMSGPEPFPSGRAWFVDGTSGLAGNSGKKPTEAFSTLTLALAAVDTGDVIYVYPKDMVATSTDPVSYAETVSITTPQVSIVGVGNGKVQGGLPQFKIGAGSTVMFDIKAPGVSIQNIGINGISSTGGGIKLTDDGGSTSAAAGFSIVNCHFKNCKAHATNGSLGGAIYWGSAGGAWQGLIKGNKFYKNVADVVLVGTSGSRPQDIVIEDNVFSGPAGSVDGNLLLNGGSGIDGVYINRNVFPCFPAIGSGSNTNVLVLTGCVGSLTDNQFGITGKTFGAAANVLVPTTILMAHNYQEDGATQIVRT
ncbi:hypothetical protein LCGC14_0344950 [marine sediment metagenome]|uniref:Right handed beta helix domain-containing protein n=1 Tax=marine sediment metagenome TaxID=412755 RepID=A0A0F9TIF4_9ZZZZ